MKRNAEEPPSKQSAASEGKRNPLTDSFAPNPQVFHCWKSSGPRTLLNRGKDRHCPGGRTSQYSPGMAPGQGTQIGRCWWVGNSTAEGVRSHPARHLSSWTTASCSTAMPGSMPGCKDGCASCAASPLGGDTSLLIVPARASAPCRSNMLRLLCAPPGTCSAHDHQHSTNYCLVSILPSKSLMP